MDFHFRSRQTNCKACKTLVETSRANHAVETTLLYSARLCNAAGWAATRLLLVNGTCKDQHQPEAWVDFARQARPTGKSHSFQGKVGDARCRRGANNLHKDSTACIVQSRACVPDIRAHSPSHICILYTVLSASLRHARNHACCPEHTAPFPYPRRGAADLLLHHVRRVCHARCAGVKSHKAICLSGDDRGHCLPTGRCHGAD